MVKLGSQSKYAGKTFPLLLEQLSTCPTNQLAMYAENSMAVINSNNRSSFIKVLQQRLPEVESQSKKKRVLKVINKVSK